MTTETEVGFRFDLDRLVVRGARVFGWGWLAHERREARSVHLVFTGGNGRRKLPATIGLARKDVARAFPHLVAAEASGFVVTGYVPAASRADLALEVEWDQGAPTRVELGSCERHAARERPAQITFARVTRSAWRRLRTLDFRGLLRGPGGSRFGVASLEEHGPRERLARALRACPGVRIVFDHSMGGGANAYRDQVIRDWTARGEAALFVTFNLPTLDYRFHLVRPGGSREEFRATTFLALEPVLQGEAIREIFLNSPVSFDEPSSLAEWLARLRRNGACERLTVAVHDYFSVCPSFVLLNHEGRFCGIPSERECANCLERHEGAHVAFSPPTSMPAWRQAWRACLEAADEVRCFSASSRSLLLRAYPSVGAKATLIPHAPDFEATPVRGSRRGAELVVGVVGQINFQKGARIVAELVELVERGHHRLRVVVIGTLDVPIRSPHLVVTGPYRREALAELVAANGIDVFLFPSIWPETFSYVVSEMMAFALPIVAFDLGAPAERLREYPGARLCAEVSAQAALEALLGLRPETAAAAA